MKSKVLGFGILGILLMGCKAPLSIAHVHTEKNIFITNALTNDKKIER